MVSTITARIFGTVRKRLDYLEIKKFFVCSSSEYFECFKDLGLLKFEGVEPVFVHQRS